MQALVIVQTGGKNTGVEWTPTKVHIKLRSRKMENTTQLYPDVELLARPFFFIPMVWVRSYISTVFVFPVNGHRFFPSVLDDSLPREIINGQFATWINTSQFATQINIDKNFNLSYIKNITISQ